MKGDFTLGGHFRDAHLERAFLVSILPMYRRFYRIVGACLAATGTFACLTNSLVYQGPLQSTIFQYIFGAFNVLVLLCVWKVKSTVPSDVSRNIVTACLGLGGVLIVAATYYMPTTMSAYMIGILSFFIIFLGIVPHRFERKILLLGTVVVAFVACAYLEHRPIPQAWTIIIIAMSLSLVTGILIGITYARYERTVYLLELSLRSQKSKIEELLHQMMPREIADQMQANTGSASMVSMHQNVSVLFADLVGFTAWSGAQTTETVVDVLDKLFSRFDVQTSLHQVEKIKTIGDAYMAVSGLPRAVDHSALEIAELALELREAVAKFSFLTGVPMQIRIGIHTGSVMAGVIGRNRMHYDLWGDTVNFASRLESQGSPGAIQASEETMLLLQDRYDFEFRGNVDLRGKGLTPVYVLRGPKLAALDLAA